MLHASPAGHEKMISGAQSQYWKNKVIRDARAHQANLHIFHLALLHKRGYHVGEALGVRARELVPFLPEKVQLKGRHGLNHLGRRGFSVEVDVHLTKRFSDQLHCDITLFCRQRRVNQDRRKRHNVVKKQRYRTFAKTALSLYCSAIFLKCGATCPERRSLVVVFCLLLLARMLNSLLKLCMLTRVSSPAKNEKWNGGESQVTIPSGTAHSHRSRSRPRPANQ